MTFDTWMTLLSIVECSTKGTAIEASRVDGRRLFALKQKGFVKVVTTQRGDDFHYETVVIPTFYGRNATRDD